MKGQMKKIPCFWQQRGNGNADRSLQNGEIASGFAENPEIQKTQECHWHFGCKISGCKI